MSDPLRQEFESAVQSCKRFYYPTDKREDGEYSNPFVESMFKGFLLGRESANPWIPVSNPPPDELLKDGIGYFITFNGADCHDWPTICCYNKRYSDVQKGWSAPGIKAWMPFPTAPRVDDGKTIPIDIFWHEVSE